MNSDPLRIEHIGSLVFATTVVSFFSYILFFTAIGQAGNGGEYWHFSGLEHPHHEAMNAYDAGDYRLLSYDITDALGNRHSDTPYAPVCDNHPFGADHFARPSRDALLHGPDSVRLARQFAKDYNDAMLSWMRYDMNFRCQITVE